MKKDSNIRYLPRTEVIKTEPVEKRLQRKYDEIQNVLKKAKDYLNKK